ncbi:hypothetical protein MGN01_11280 [Methylobacterium gnaphalii]|uniref:Uncharacterized protein n=1 Tax=Methylobacterium gnaphalii TaxID=1010610 RepID=A0A512JH86_9HYPH|nr:hypothetical protein MGN01_11280 [Methylobacterium gnaphalii]GLS50984.1 hypothetical protein GCM10007885_38380 [Methylobacterium gnaphalii]
MYGGARLPFLDVGFFKYAVSEIWKISDAQALIKFFFESSRNLMVTAAVGLAASIGHSAPLEVLYSIALFAVGFQISSAVIIWLEALINIHIHTIVYILVFYVLVALPCTLYINGIVKKTVISIIDAQSFGRSEPVKTPSRPVCIFTFDLNDFACPSELGIKR